MSNNDLSQLSRARLAQLGREYMAAAQFNSRTGYAALRINHGDEAYKKVAIDNWMAASPIYTRRMQRAMGFAGTSEVATIFKGLQLECGLSHQYFNAHFEVFSATEGRFWLESCGPLLETEPRGEDAVRVMCHDIEDPTFDATAIATNPRARMRPVHRPPRITADSAPHCEWRVFIDADAEPLAEPAVTGQLQQSALASLAISRPAHDLEPGGIAYYNGGLQEQLHLEQLSHAALVVVCKELALQNHLLIKGLTMVVEALYGREAAQAVAEFQMIGSAAVMGERLSRWAGHDAGGIDAIVAVLSVHPLFQPIEYQAITIEKVDEHSAVIALHDSTAQEDHHILSWLTLLDMGFTDGLAALVQAVDPRAQCQQCAPGARQWRIEVHANGTPAQEPLPVQIAKGTVLYQTRFEDRLQLLQLQV
ncbi:MAG: hypothetical protein R3E64_12465 [Halioglobus sp.]